MAYRFLDCAILSRPSDLTVNNCQILLPVRCKTAGEQRAMNRCPTANNSKRTVTRSLINNERTTDRYEWHEDKM